eukprot:COSAG01_NODE_2761_length_7116_cov_27.151489_12_plen_165_part_00
MVSISVRFYRPKERNSMPVNSKGYTRWITIPVISDKLVCFATLAADYISLTEAQPISDDAFILCERPLSKYGNRLGGLSSERLAKCMRAVMSAAGIPEDFMSHSARHAGIAFRKGGAATAIALGYQTAPWCDKDVMTHARMSAHTYVTHYLRNIRAAEIDGADG